MKTNPLVWITGAGGLIGHHLVQRANREPCRIVPLTRDSLDLENQKALAQKVKTDQPDLIFHCAAISKTVACQSNPQLAWRINVDAVRVLSEATHAARLIFLSSDLVFDGQKGNYREEDPVNPLSVYAETKAAAEQLLQQHPNHLIVRTSLNYGRSPTGDRSFNEEMNKAWRAGKTLTLFADEFRSPIPAAVTAAALWELAFAPSGIIHLAGVERLSRWAIGRLIAEKEGEMKRIREGSLRDYQGPPRSPDTSLNCERAQRHLSWPLPLFSQWLTGFRGA